MTAKIDFLIIGAQKAGTTSLHRYLRQHPAVFMPEQKDLPFFVDAGTSEVRERDFHHFYGERNGAVLDSGIDEVVAVHSRPANRNVEAPRSDRSAVHVDVAEYHIVESQFVAKQVNPLVLLRRSRNGSEGHGHVVINGHRGPHPKPEEPPQQRWRTPVWHWAQ